uniref:Uncharacterized protein n=1 Tax=Schistosoma japonicum TaxID=6182 RepID=C1L8B3_SCHJA|nr:hypothetical protein [Schistosoma japonicum]
MPRYLQLCDNMYLLFDLVVVETYYCDCVVESEKFYKVLLQNHISNEQLTDLSTLPSQRSKAGFSYQLPSQSSGQGSGSCSSSDINRTQCPICRSTYKNISTSWELISAKSPKSHRRQISGIVLRLISRTGRPSDTFPEVDSDGVTDGNEETSFTVIGHKHNPAENV